MTYSFIKNVQGRTDFLVSPCKVSGCSEDNRNVFPEKEWSALWDTGATGTVISPQMVKSLQLLSDSYSLASTIHGKKWVPQYRVNIQLPSGMVSQKLSVIEGDPEGADMLIGMDIIGEGDFICSCCNGTTQFGFRVPSEITKENMEQFLGVSAT